MICCMRQRGYRFCAPFQNHIFTRDTTIAHPLPPCVWFHATRRLQIWIIRAFARTASLSLSLSNSFSVSIPSFPRLFTKKHVCRRLRERIERCHILHIYRISVNVMRELCGKIQRSSVIETTKRWNRHRIGARETTGASSLTLKKKQKRTIKKKKKQAMAVSGSGPRISLISRPNETSSTLFIICRDPRASYIPDPHLKTLFTSPSLISVRIHFGYIQRLTYSICCRAIMTKQSLIKI